MNMNEQNFIQQLKEKNEKALMYVIDEYGGLIRSDQKEYVLPDRISGRVFQ